MHALALCGKATVSMLIPGNHSTDPKLSPHNHQTDLSLARMTHWAKVTEPHFKSFFSLLLLYWEGFGGTNKRQTKDEKYFYLFFFPKQKKSIFFLDSFSEIFFPVFGPDKLSSLFFKMNLRDDIKTRVLHHGRYHATAERCHWAQHLIKWQTRW